MFCRGSLVPALFRGTHKGSPYDLLSTTCVQNPSCSSIPDRQNTLRVASKESYRFPKFIFVFQSFLRLRLQEVLGSEAGVAHRPPIQRSL